jgi:hypothetical protein
MSQEPIIVIKRTNRNKISNIIAGSFCILFGSAFIGLLLYSKYENPTFIIILFFVIGSLSIVSGLYCWSCLAHKVFLFKYEIQSKVFLFTKKTPIDSSTTLSYEEYRNKSTALYYLSFITPTQDKKLTIRSKCWDNEAEFLTKLDIQISRIRASTPHLNKNLAKKAKKIQKKKKSKRNRRHQKKKK